MSKLLITAAEVAENMDCSERHGYKLAERMEGHKRGLKSCDGRNRRRGLIIELSKRLSKWELTIQL